MRHSPCALSSVLAGITFGALLFAPASPEAQAPRTVQDGIFSAAQAARGQTLFKQQCAGCHQPAPGTAAAAPPLSGEAFISRWRREPLSALFIKIRYTMPPPAAAGASLTHDQAADVVAHLLASNNFPPGTTDFAAADAVTSAISWPALPAAAPAQTAVSQFPPAGTLNQLMRGIFFPSSNLIFTVQEREAKDLPPKPATTPDGITIYEWGHMVYTGWPVVENAAVSLADASALLLQPGLRCENGRPAPITEPDWIRFTEQMIDVARRTYRLAQTQDRDAVSEYTADLSEACAACHRVYRDVGGRGRGRGAGAPSGIASARCTHR